MFAQSGVGLLAVGTMSNLSIYTLVLENDLPTWSLKWTLPLVAFPIKPVAVLTNTAELQV